MKPLQGDQLYVVRLHESRQRRCCASGIDVEFGSGVRGVGGNHGAPGMQQRRQNTNLLLKRLRRMIHGGMHAPIDRQLPNHPFATRSHRLHTITLYTKAVIWVDAWACPYASGTEVVPPVCSEAWGHASLQHLHTPPAMHIILNTIFASSSWMSASFPGPSCCHAASCQVQTRQGGSPPPFSLQWLTRP